MVISIRLGDMDDAGSPAIMAYHDMYSWFPRGDIQYVDMPFDLSPPQRALYGTAMEDLVGKLTVGEYKK